MFRHHSLGLTITRYIVACGAYLVFGEVNAATAQRDSFSALCTAPKEAEGVQETRPIKRTWTISRMQLIGGFRTPRGYFHPGKGKKANWKTTPLHTMAYSDGAIAIKCSRQQITATMSGHARGNLLIEFEVPNLSPVNQNPAKWLRAKRIVQGFSSWKGKPSDKLAITGLRHEAGRLIIGRYFRYDASGKHRHGTGVLADATNISNSTFTGWLDTPGPSSTGMGWVSPLPAPWQTQLQATHVMGGGAGWSILSRDTIGPSAFTVTLHSLLQATKERPVNSRPRQNFPYPSVVGGTPDRRRTRRLLAGGFEIKRGSPGFKEIGPWPWPKRPVVWTALSQARYGVVLRDGTYLAVGNSAGERFGVGYKGPKSKTRPRGVDYWCGGYCPYDPKDRSVRYWLFDVRDWLSGGGSKAGRLIDTGILPVPKSLAKKKIGGGDFDEKRGLLYLSHLRADENNPVVSVWKVY